MLLPSCRCAPREKMQSNTILRSDVGSTEKLMGNNNNLNNNGSPGADIMFQMEDEGLTQLGSVFQSAYQSIVGGGPQVRDRHPSIIHPETEFSFKIWAFIHGWDLNVVNAHGSVILHIHKNCKTTIYLNSTGFAQVSRYHFYRILKYERNNVIIDSGIINIAIATAI